jgi:hypothetical protein
VNRHRAGLRLCRDERGQSTAMVVVMLWVLILFVALVANVGQAVNRRIALQTVADAGAFTGATKMAEGLNYMSHANATIQDFWGMTTWAWLANTLAIGGTCAAFDGINGAYKGLYYAMYIPQTAINYAYGGVGFGTVRYEADRVSAYNAADLFPGEHLEFDEFDLDPSVGIPPSRDFLNLISLEDVPDGTDANTEYDPVPPLGSGFTSSHTQGCWTTCGILPCYIPQNWTFPAWQQRSGSDTRYFVWIATAPPTRALIFDSFFGPNAIPEMKAVGVAKPVGGDIKEGLPKYVAKMVPVSKVNYMGGRIMDSLNPWSPMRRVTH